MSNNRIIDANYKRRLKIIQLDNSILLQTGYHHVDNSDVIEKYYSNNYNIDRILKRDMKELLYVKLHNMKKIKT